jgi:hypothetical protein
MQTLGIGLLSSVRVKAGAAHAGPHLHGLQI